MDEAMSWDTSRISEKIPPKPIESASIEPMLGMPVQETPQSQNLTIPQAILPHRRSRLRRPPLRSKINVWRRIRHFIHPPRLQHLTRTLPRCSPNNVRTKLVLRP